MLAKLIAIIPISELEKAGARRKSKCVDTLAVTGGRRPSYTGNMTLLFLKLLKNLFSFAANVLLFFRAVDPHSFFFRTRIDLLSQCVSGSSFKKLLKKLSYT